MSITLLKQDRPCVRVSFKDRIAYDRTIMALKMGCPESVVFVCGQHKVEILDHGMGIGYNIDEYAYPLHKKQLKPLKASYELDIDEMRRLASMGPNPRYGNLSRGVK